MPSIVLLPSLAARFGISAGLKRSVGNVPVTGGVVGTGVGNGVGVGVGVGVGDGGGLELELLLPELELAPVVTLDSPPPLQPTIETIPTIARTAVGTRYIDNIFFMALPHALLWRIIRKRLSNYAPLIRSALSII
jgi:hypothetical protein